MRVAMLGLAIGSLSIFACGGGSGSSLDGGSDVGSGQQGPFGSGGSITGGTGGTSGGAGSAGSCSIACLNQAATLVQNCQPSGSCTSQESISGSTISATACYSNGVKMGMSMGAGTGTSSAMSITATFKKSSAVCYTMVMNADISGAGTVDFKNASGGEVATITVDASGGQTVTCPGQAPVAIDAACSSASDTVSSAGDTQTDTCTAGTCAL